MRHEIAEALVRWFHAETDTFHLSCEEYAVIPLDWTAILGIKVGGHQISTDEITFEMVGELLGISLLLNAETRGYFRPTASSQICIEGLQHSIPWDKAPTNAYLCRCFLWFLGSYFGQQPILVEFQLLWAMGGSLQIRACD